MPQGNYRKAPEKVILKCTVSERQGFLLRINIVQRECHYQNLRAKKEKLGIYRYKEMISQTRSVVMVKGRNCMSG